MRVFAVVMTIALVTLANQVSRADEPQAAALQAAQQPQISPQEATPEHASRPITSDAWEHPFPVVTEPPGYQAFAKARRPAKRKKSDDAVEPTRQNPSWESRSNWGADRRW